MIMTKINQKIIFRILICLVFVFGIAGSVIAINSQNEGYRSNAGTTITVDVHDDCHKVVNSSGNDYFIPTRTNNPEWQAFQGSLPPGVSLEACCEDDPSCAGRSEGDTFCIDSSYRGTCTDTNGDGCLEQQSQYCPYGCSGGNCNPCIVTDMTDHKACIGSEVYWYDNCWNRRDFVEDCATKPDTTPYEIIDCDIYGGSSYTYNLRYTTYDGTCTNGTCNSEIVMEGPYNGDCGSGNYCGSTPVADMCFPCPEDHYNCRGAQAYDGYYYDCQEGPMGGWMASGCCTMNVGPACPTVLRGCGAGPFDTEAECWDFVNAS
jgi:hypothetical protein